MIDGTKKLQENIIKNTIETLKENIENNATIPYPTKMVLNNPKLRGICDVIGNVISVEDKYLNAITTALGISSTYVIVDDEESAKEAIKYLKNNVCF